MLIQLCKVLKYAGGGEGQIAVSTEGKQEPVISRLGGLVLDLVIFWLAAAACGEQH